MTLPVLTAVTGSWEAGLVAGLERSPTDVRVVRRCVDLAELLAAAAAGLARAVVLSADLQRLDREAVAQLISAAVAVVGLADPSDPLAAGRLRALGVQRVLPADAQAEDVAQAVAAAVEELARGTPARWAFNADPALALAPPGFGPPGSGTGSGTGIGAVDGAPPEPGSDAVPGRVVAVWGPTGAPGRTTVALALAALLAAARLPTVLVDADTYGPCLAQSLGLLEEGAGLAAAVRAANAGELDVARLAQLAPLVSPDLRILTGLSRPSRWPELRPSGLEVVWRTTRELARWTVIDCGFCLETDEEVSFDTSAPRRNATTLCALAEADVVVAVGAGDPVGLQRLVRGLQELGDVLPPGRTPRVVVTRVRASAVGPSPTRRIEESLARYAGVRDPVLLPEDRSGVDAAMLAGRTMVEAVPGSPVLAALASLAADLAGTEPTRSSRRWRGRARVGVS